MANIKLNNNEYSIPDSKLTTPRADFVAHLTTIEGDGIRVVVDGVEYNVDPNKVADAVAEIEVLLEELNTGGGDEPVALAAGLYQTGTNTLITSWDELLTDGIVHVDNGVVYTNYSSATNGSADALAGDLILPNDGSIISLGDYNFKDNTGRIAFSMCKKITNIIIPNSVTLISDCAFNSCTSFTNIIIPNSVTSMGYSTFNNCQKLVNVTLSENLTKISTSLLSNCDSLTSIIIPNGVDHISGYAFSGCKQLAYIVIPNTVTYISDYVFNKFTALTDVYYTGTEEDWEWSIYSLGFDSTVTFHYNYVPEE